MRSDHFKFAVVVSANAEWKAVKSGFPNARIENSPYGECFFEPVDEEIVPFCHLSYAQKWPPLPKRGDHLGHCSISPCMLIHQHE